MGLPVSTYHLIFDVLVRCQKIIIFGRLPDGPQKIEKIEPWSAKRRKKEQIRLRRGDFWDRGPRGASRAVLLNNKTTGSIKGDVVCHADGRWPGDFLVQIRVWDGSYRIEETKLVCAISRKLVFGIEGPKMDPK